MSSNKPLVRQAVDDSDPVIPATLFRLHGQAVFAVCLANTHISTMKVLRLPAAHPAALRCLRLGYLGCTRWARSSTDESAAEAWSWAAYLQISANSAAAVKV